MFGGIVTHPPLRGVRILELGGYVSGPYGTSLLAALGADVVKIERPGTGDDFRRQQDDQSLYFKQYNAGKRSLALDLKHPAGVRILKDLLPQFDVLLENMRPGKLSALGLDPQECMARNPDLIYVSVSGFGEGGPLSERPAYDTIGQAFGGLYSVLGDEDRPQLSGALFGDLVTGLTTGMGILAALVGRKAGTGGQLVQTSILEAVSTMTIDNYTQYLDTGRSSPTRQSRHPQAQNFCVRASSGQYVAIHLSSSQKFWRGLATALGRAELIDDPRFADYDARTRHYFELTPIVQAEIVKRTADDWERILTENDVPFTQVLDMETWSHHPQTEWLELLEPERDGVSLVRPPWRFNGQRPNRDSRAPRVGEDTIAVVQSVRTPEQIAELADSGVLFVATSETVGA
ncbi:CaiB/BaiF CoA transferase family protein [Rhodococcus wratislaviensis]|uniref:CaiB/BaiF CoA transferase family protein n=1 Tax=Rhodococcus wratislaviensis TaxID=44752 RepID=UPI0036612B71